MPPEVQMALALQAYQEAYASVLRASFFSGSLTIASFLFAVKVFIVVRMKDIYDDDSYHAKVAAARKVKKDYHHYRELERLATLLFATIVSALVSAGLQLTLGLLSHWIAATICILAAATASILMLVSVVYVRLNLLDWFRYLEEKSRARNG